VYSHKTPAGRGLEKRLKNWDLVKNQESAIMLVLLDYAWSTKQAFSYNYPSGEKGEGYEQCMLGSCSGNQSGRTYLLPRRVLSWQSWVFGWRGNWHVADTSFGVANDAIAMLA